MRQVARFPDAEALAQAAAEEVDDHLRRAVQDRGVARLALSGGSTPRALYTLLARRVARSPVWRATHLYWGDERLVPPNSPDSNFGLVRDTLLAGGGISADHVHPIPTEEGDADGAARQYESTLQRDCGSGPDGFDLALLGLGEDGHTASLFPGSAALAESERWVVGVPRSPQPPFVPRVTVTLPFLNRARAVLFLVSGEGKSEILAKVLDERTPPATRLPAARVECRGTTAWFVDEAAAAELPARASAREG